MNIYHFSDPAVHSLPVIHNWWFCYLHGVAQHINEAEAKANGWDWQAPDCFVTDEPYPEKAGEYIGNLYGNEVVIVVAPHLGGLGGRAAINNPKAPCYKHVHNPEEWR